jgi:hypothetical protein
MSGLVHELVHLRRVLPHSTSSSSARRVCDSGCEACAWSVSTRARCARHGRVTHADRCGRRWCSGGACGDIYRAGRGGRGHGRGSALGGTDIVAVRRTMSMIDRDGRLKRLRSLNTEVIGRSEFLKYNEDISNILVSRLSRNRGMWLCAYVYGRELPRSKLRTCMYVRRYRL